MRPFNDKDVPFEYEGEAYGIHYAIHVANGTDGWLATSFIRFGPNDKWYGKVVEDPMDIIQDAAFEMDELPREYEITYCDYGVTPGSGLPDHSGWWIGITFQAQTFEKIVETAEALIEVSHGEDIIVTGPGGEYERIQQYPEQKPSS